MCVIIEKKGSLENRREVQLMLFMHKQTQNLDLLKKSKKKQDYIRLQFLKHINLIMKKPVKM